MIDDKAVEAAARAACAGLWDRLTPAAQEATLINMRAALSVALPLLWEGKREEIARVIDPEAFKPDGDATSRDLDHDHPKGIAVARDERRQRRGWARAKADRIIAMLGGGE